VGTRYVCGKSATRTRETLTGIEREKLKWRELEKNKKKGSHLEKKRKVSFVGNGTS